MAALAFTSGGALGYEIDPFTNRHVDIADSMAVLDREVNASLDDLASDWSRGESEVRFAYAVFRRLGGYNFVDKLERWAMYADEVEKIPVRREESILRDYPPSLTRFAAFFFFGPTINVGGVYMGTDKLGHFFSQGRKFYRRYRRHGDEAQAARWSTITEAGIFGRLTTGIFSNADLVANYEGHLFYRSLFQPGVASKPAMFRWQDGKPVRQRDFTWADHVNAYWDEALNPNDYKPSLLPDVYKRLLTLCADHAQRPERYGVPDAQALAERYRHVGLSVDPSLQAGTFLAANCPHEGVEQASPATDAPPVRPERERRIRASRDVTAFSD